MLIGDTKSYYQICQLYIKHNVFLLKLFNVQSYEVISTPMVVILPMFYPFFPYFIHISQVRLRHRTNLLDVSDRNYMNHNTIDVIIPKMPVTAPITASLYDDLTALSG